MNIKLELICGLSLVSLAGCGGSASKSGESKQVKAQPNVIFIVADDLGFGDMSC